MEMNICLMPAAVAPLFDCYDSPNLRLTSRNRKDEKHTESVGMTVVVRP